MLPSCGFPCSQYFLIVPFALCKTGTAQSFESSLNEGQIFRNFIVIETPTYSVIVLFIGIKYLLCQFLITIKRTLIQIGIQGWIWRITIPC